MLAGKRNPPGEGALGGIPCDCACLEASGDVARRRHRQANCTRRVAAGSDALGA